MDVKQNRGLVAGAPIAGELASPKRSGFGHDGGMLAPCFAVDGLDPRAHWAVSNAMFAGEKGGRATDGKRTKRRAAPTRADCKRG
jgi:hypothetical protein